MRVINFGAGPAKLPQEVLTEVQSELVAHGDSGVSVLEMSHRSTEYLQIHNDALNSVSQLLNVPSNYKVLFLQGGGTGMFAAIAMNLMSRTGSADYLVTGSWSAKAAKEAAKYGRVNLVLPATDGYTQIPSQESWNLSADASYLYYCANETVHGVEFPFEPESKGVPLVADMSSNIFTKPIDVSKFGVIFAGAQKNIGPAGVTLVIVREDLLGSPLSICPLVMDFTVMSKDNSLHNTPPTFGVYVVGRVLEWIKNRGGVEGMAASSEAKSQLLYSCIDSSKGFYKCPVDKCVRSRMNVPFTLSTPELEQDFLNGAKQLNMIQLKGHRSVGGIRASLYNAVSLTDVQTLVDYMTAFMDKHGVHNNIH